MCVITVVPRGVSLSQSDFEDMWHTNPDGGGVMWASCGKLLVRKTLKRDELWAFYTQALDMSPEHIVLHFRVGTHGHKSIHNCHPFVIHEGTLGVVHNGILGYVDKTQRDKSDTWLFAHRVLDHLPREFWKNPGIRFLVESVLGGGNKLVLLDASGELTYLGEFERCNGYTVSNRYWEYMSIRPSSFGETYGDGRGLVTRGRIQEDPEDLVICPHCGELIDLWESWSTPEQCCICTECKRTFDPEDGDTSDEYDVRALRE